MWAFKNRGLVSLWDATHCNRAKTLHALFDVLLSSSGGESKGYTATISCNKAAIVPTECQMKGANSEKCSRYRDSSSNALSLFAAYFNSSICLIISYFSYSETPVFCMKLDALDAGFPMLKSPRLSAWSTILDVLAKFWAVYCWNC